MQLSVADTPHKPQHLHTAALHSCSSTVARVFLSPLRLVCFTPPNNAAAAVLACRDTFAFVYACMHVIAVAL